MVMFGSSEKRVSGEVVTFTLLTWTSLEEKALQYMIYIYLFLSFPSRVKEKHAAISHRADVSWRHLNYRFIKSMTRHYVIDNMLILYKCINL